MEAKLLQRSCGMGRRGGRRESVGENLEILDLLGEMKLSLQQH